MKKPTLLFFQQILPGDVRKQQARSNDADTGGGARDLRVPDRFAPLLLPLFPHPTENEGVTQNNVYWFNSQGGITSTSVELWRPTGARPNETRLARITAIESWVVDPNAYNKAHALGETWFFLLVMDAGNRVWAQTYEEQYWRGPQTDAEIRQYFVRRIECTRKGWSVRGFMNFKTGENYG